MLFDKKNSQELICLEGLATLEHKIIRNKCKLGSMEISKRWLI